MGWSGVRACGRATPPTHSVKNSPCSFTSGFHSENGGAEVPGFISIDYVWTAPACSCLVLNSSAPVPVSDCPYNLPGRRTCADLLRHMGILSVIMHLLLVTWQG